MFDRVMASSRNAEERRRVFGLLLFGAMICVSTTLVSLGLLYRTSPVQGSAQEVAAECQRRNASLQVLLVANYLAAVLVGMVSLYPLAQTPAARSGCSWCCFWRGRR